MDKTKIGLGIASLPVRSLWEGIKLTEDMGFRTIELCPFWGEDWVFGYLPGFCFDELSGEEKRKLREKISRFDYVSAHAPFINTPLFTFNKGIKNEVIRQIKGCIDVTSHLCGSMVTIHINPKSPFLKVTDYWQEIIETCRDLGDYAGNRKLRMGIETLFPNETNQYIDLIMEIGHPFVGATVDVGHMHYYICHQLHRTVAGEEKFNKDLLHLITELKDKVYHLHLHNVRKSDWRDHMSVTDGIIDYDALFSALRKTGYHGLMVLEFGGTCEEVMRWAVSSKDKLECLLEKKMLNNEVECF